LAACDLEFGKGRMTLSGAVDVDDLEGEVECRYDWPDGSTATSRLVWFWTGTIDGEDAWLYFGPATDDQGDVAALAVGDQTWAAGETWSIDIDEPGEIVFGYPDHGGTLTGSATLVPESGSVGVDEVEVSADLRCESFGHAEFSGDIEGQMYGRAACWSSWVWGRGPSLGSSRHEGQVQGTLWIQDDRPPAPVRYRDSGSNYWRSVDENGDPAPATVLAWQPGPGQPGGEEGLHNLWLVTAALHREDGEPGEIEVTTLMRPHC
jgi:hypothetical protein